MFEHLSFHDGELHLDACMKILRHGGTLEMMLPNMDYHVQQWLSKDPAQMDHARAGFWGWQREGDTQLWDVHKSGYTDDQLIALVTELGYTNARSIRKRSDNHLEIVCYKG